MWYANRYRFWTTARGEEGRQTQRRRGLQRFAEQRQYCTPSCSPCKDTPSVDVCISNQRITNHHFPYRFTSIWYVYLLSQTPSIVANTPFPPTGHPVHTIKMNYANCKNRSPNPTKRRALVSDGLPRPRTWTSSRPCTKNSRLRCKTTYIETSRQRLNLVWTNGMKLNENVSQFTLVVIPLCSIYNLRERKKRYAT